MKTAARTAWKSAHEFSCLVYITSNHIGKMLGYFSTTRVGQCHCPHRFRCVAQWPHQKMHFRFSVSMRRLAKFRPNMNAVAAVGLATWKCDAMVLCCASVVLWKMQNWENERHVQSLDLYLHVSSVSLSLSLSLSLCANSRNPQIYPVISISWRYLIR